MRKYFFLGLSVILLITACGKRNEDNVTRGSTADWAYEFVVFHGAIYRASGGYAAMNLQKQIGEVTHYSDLEMTARQGVTFSNRFVEGSKLFEIEGTSIREAIAVQRENGTFEKLVYEGPYAYQALDP